jgi:SMI1 / KNR4 family (SUKH-1)
MQTPWEILQSALRETLTDAGRTPLEIRLLPPLSQGELAQLETELGRKLPADLRELLVLCRGFEFSPVGTVDFSGGEMSVAIPFAAIPVLPDGSGNFWVVDIEPEERSGSVMFWCHDPAVMVIQAPTLSEFVQQALGIGRPGHSDPLTFIKEERSRQIWADDPYLVRAAEARESADPDLAAFATELSGDFYIADLRKREIGSGFSWGRTDSDVRRFKDKLIFGIEKKTSLFGKLFRRQLKTVLFN